MAYLLIEYLMSMLIFLISINDHRGLPRVTRFWRFMLHHERHLSPCWAGMEPSKRNQKFWVPMASGQASYYYTFNNHFEIQQLEVHLHQQHLLG
jgi:hypothetical protein